MASLDVKARDKCQEKLTAVGLYINKLSTWLSVEYGNIFAQLKTVLPAAIVNIFYLLSATEIGLFKVL